MSPRLLSNFDNIILNTDTYKHSHWNLYPPNTTHVSSYIESRGGEYPAHLFVGLQAFIKKHLLRPITIDDIDEAEIVTRQHQIPFNREGWLGIVNEHNGYLPVEIEAVPEGTVLPIKNVLVQIVNTDPKYPWVTSFIETALLRSVWYPTSVGTTSWLAKQLIREALEKTSDHPEILRRIARLWCSWSEFPRVCSSGGPGASRQLPTNEHHLRISRGYSLLQRSQPCYFPT